MFLVPCRVDDMPPDAEGIPREFRDAHVSDVRSDEALADFVARVTALFRRFRPDWAGDA